MKKTVMAACVVLMAMAVGSQAATYTWTGASTSGQAFNDAGNWITDSSAWTTGNPQEQYSDGKVNDDANTITITNGDTVVWGDSSGDVLLQAGTGHCGMTLNNATTLSNTLMRVAETAGGSATLNLQGGSTLHVVSIRVGTQGTGIANVVDSTVIHTATDPLYLSVNNGSSGTMNVSGASSVTVGDRMIVGNNTGTGTLNLSGTSTITMNGHLFIGDEAGSKGYLNMTGGTMNVGADGSGSMYIGEGTTLASGGEGKVVIDDGMLNIAQALLVGYNSGTSHLTVNGGKVTTAVGGNLRVGSSSNPEARLFLNGGTVQVGRDLYFEGNDSKIVYVDGELLAIQTFTSEADMQAFIDNGDIDVSGAAGYSINTVDIDGTAYTQLIPEPATLGLLSMLGGGMLFIRRRFMI